ncbi:hypothetical protein ACFOOK_09155 [Micromonospora krabiensis]|uniref:Uncharacterized protein n=1 Tax=Micromonospora krabiensis TaxID=307121 RepID=A0A1C3NB65_9ACTN|nr:hypothetical protein [Micromonospora krabiensis]SBV29837.1 hypothetical protein GA0070620_5420 [Micromonospora krabiensis]
MSENYTDPSGNTEAFRAFVHTPEAEAPAGTAGRLPMLVGAAFVAAVLLALAVWLAVG